MIDKYLNAYFWGIFHYAYLGSYLAVLRSYFELCNWRFLSDGHLGIMEANPWLLHAKFILPYSAIFPIWTIFFPFHCLLWSSISILEDMKTSTWNIFFHYLIQFGKSTLHTLFFEGMEMGKKLNPEVFRSFFWQGFRESKGWMGLNSGQQYANLLLSPSPSF